MKRPSLKFLALLAGLALAPVAAHAQGTQVVTTCGASTMVAGQTGRPLLIDATGNLCTNASGSGGGLSVTDQAAWTQASSSFTPGGGVFNDTATLNSGQQGTARLTTKRAQIVDVDTTGNALYSSIAQLHTDLTSPQVGGTNTIGNIGAGVTAYTPFVPAASDNHQNIKTSAGVVYSVAVTNNSATKNYLRLYDAAAAFNGCNSATGVIFAMEIPPNDSGFSVATGGVNGLAFTNGLALCVTSGFGLTDTTNATATAMYVNIGYK